MVPAVPSPRLVLWCGSFALRMCILRVTGRYFRRCPLCSAGAESSVTTPNVVSSTGTESSGGSHLPDQLPSNSPYCLQPRHNKPICFPEDRTTFAGTNPWPPLAVPPCTEPRGAQPAAGSARPSGLCRLPRAPAVPRRCTWEGEQNGHLAFSGSRPVSHVPFPPNAWGEEARATRRRCGLFGSGVSAPVSRRATARPSEPAPSPSSPASPPLLPIRITHSIYDHNYSVS